MLVPYHVDVPMERVPIANFALIGVTVLVHLGFLASGGEITLELATSLPIILFGHMFLHADLIHLSGNMLFLWVFGNAICSKVGNLAYVPVYLGVGLAAMIVHILIDGRPGIGASGAINGVVGMFLVWYVRNEISCAYYYFYHWGVITLSSRWIILLWFAFDIWGAVRGEGDVAYLAHIGGFLAGLALAVGLLAIGWIKMSRGECSLFGLFSAEGDR